MPMMPKDLYTYVEAAMPETPSPYFVPKPVYPKFMPPKDDVLLAEEQPLPTTISPTADSPSYITKFDPEEDLEEDDEDPADYPTDRDDDDDDEEESSRDDSDDDEEEDENEEEEEEEEHLALANSISPPVCRTTSRMSIRDQTPIPFLSEVEVDRFLAISTPPPLPLTSYSSPLPQIPSPPLPVSSPLPISPPPLPASLTHSLGYRAAMIRLRAELPSSSHPLPLPIVLLHTRASMAMMRVVAPSTYILVSRSETSLISMDKSKITRKQPKASKHGHENQKSTKRSQRSKAEARKVKPQCPQLDQTATNEAQMIEEMIANDWKNDWPGLKDWRAGLEILEASFSTYK
ncbi:hypothetical protein Tco_1311661 [Tanacetum coccineum]